MRQSSRRLREALERSQIQSAVEPAVVDALEKLGLTDATLDVPHARRAARALIRIAARLARGHGSDQKAFAGLALEAFAAEPGHLLVQPKTVAQA